MTLEETIDLLTIAAAFDRRTIGEADAHAWHATLGDLPFDGCREAIIGHYRDSREWIMPADIRARVKRTARERGDRDRIRQILDPAAYRAQIAADDRVIAELVARGGRRLRAIEDAP